MKGKKEKFILWFEEILKSDVPIVGGKNAGLGEMYQKLSKKGVKVPPGFAISAEAYRYLLKAGKIEKKIKEILSDLDTRDIKNLQDRGEKIRQLIENAPLPRDLEKEIVRAYQELSKRLAIENPDVAVRSSATAEDLPDASFAGQQETYLNVEGEEELLKSVKMAFASLFTNRAISYREDKGFDHFQVALSIAVQKMVRSDLASSGVIFTLDTESGFKEVVYITGAWGLGEFVVQGAVNPDQFYVFKPMINSGKNAIIDKILGTKEKKLIYGVKNQKTKEKITEKLERNSFVLSDEEILKLAKWACIIEEHYKIPMDIEWAKDGETGELFIVQARPETVHSQKREDVLETYVLTEPESQRHLLLRGEAVGKKIGRGEANVILETSKISKFKPGQVLVTDMTNPDWEPIMKIAQAIIANRGGRTCFTGDTIVLTNIGFLPIKKMVENYKNKNFKVLSLNRDTLKLEWKKVIGGFERVAPVMSVGISQTGRMQNNELKVSPDHKFLFFKDRKLVSKELKELLRKKEMLLSLNRIPPLKVINLDLNLAYLLGAISTDGHIYLSRTHGEVQFIQKDEPSKKEFIKKVKCCFEKVYKYSLHPHKKKISSGIIRGKIVKGEATAYRCYGKGIATDLLKKQEKIITTLLSAPEDFIYNFLAGVIDGDGTFGQGSQRINIFCSKEYLLEAITLSCLKLGIDYQVSTNRSIYNVQLVNNFKNIFDYTTRVKGEYFSDKTRGRFFSAFQLLRDIKEEVNYKGRILPYIKQNLLIRVSKINNYIMPRILGEPANHELTKIINSPLKSLRANFKRRLGLQKVYNITVEDNHNYVVFTNRYTPIIADNCHAAIVSRELGVPCVIGAQKATSILKTGQKVTIDCSEGVGNVYEGLLDFRVDKLNLGDLPKTKTRIMMNAGIPEQAFSHGQIPCEGVGLAREEFIINSHIGIHPLALINYKELKKSSDEEIKKIIKKIDEKTRGYENKVDFFIEKLAYGVARIAASFYPYDVIVRFSDFKTNEYANLIGGEFYEPRESNPMIGWRGASRYYDPRFKEAFGLECKAIKKVREEMGLKNIKVMVPFCRTVEEGKKVIETMKEFGLSREENGLEVYMMVEIPSNVILIEEFCKVFDGFSIGSNDLTQLTLGLDRDSELVSHIYDERNQAVKDLIKKAIEVARKNNRKIGICGQAPSDFPDFAEFLVECGISSISLNPDTVIKTKLAIHKKEKELGI